jgi:amino acid permease
MTSTKSMQESLIIDEPSYSSVQSQISFVSTADLAVPVVREGHTYVGFAGSVANLVNCLVGAGLLGMASTFKDSGLIPTVVLMMFIASLSWIATAMMLVLQHETESDGVDEIAGKVMGSKGQMCFSAMILFFNSCALMAYLIISTDFILSWLRLVKIDGSSRFMRAGITFAYAILIPIPISMPRSLKFLSYVSIFTDILVLFFVVGTLIRMVGSIQTHGISPSVRMTVLDLHIFGSLAVQTLAFALPTSVCPVLADSSPDVRTRNRQCFWGLFIALLLCVVPSVAAYLQFGDGAQANVLNTYPDDDRLMTAARIAFFLQISFSYPALHPSVVASWGSILFKLNSAVDLGGCKRLIVLFISNSIPLAIAMFLPDIKPVLEIAGSVGGNLGCFAFPAMLWVVHSKEKKYHWTNVLAILFAIFGWGTAILSTWSGVLDVMKEFS